METSGGTVKGSRSRSASSDAGFSQISIEHYFQLIWHRKWLVLGIFVAVSVATAIVSSRLPDVYVSEAVILVDPQKVPDAYVRPTVTGDIRSRLGTLSQQILSATRLQKIIDTLNLYPEERKRLPREEVITRMRRDISVQVVNVVSEFGGNQDLQAFRIGYSGREPRLVAQVANDLASLFIEENLKTREQQATGTSEFLQNQLQETRKTLEAQEAKLKDFKLKHMGEMPEQQAASLQILGQLQSQLQLESDALNRAEQQKAYVQSMMATQTNAPVVDFDETEQKPRSQAAAQTPARSAVSGLKAKLAGLLTRYSEDHPDVRRLRRQIEDEEAKEAKSVPSAVVAASEPVRPAAPVKSTQRPPVSARSSNPVLESQLRTIDAEIAKHKEEQQRLLKVVARYQSKLEAIPIREQQITDLVRDYEISKAHYKNLLEKQLSADTATQLEIRQKGERFTTLDPAQPAERPSRPNRTVINLGGALAGLALGLMIALATEFLGVSITGPEQILAATGLPVLEVIPVIRTHADRVARQRRLFWTAVSAAAIVLCSGAVLLYHYRDRVF